MFHFFKLSLISLALSPWLSMAADLPYAHMKFFTEYASKVTDLRVPAGKAKALKIELAKSEFEDQTTYEIAIGFVQKKNVLNVNYNIVETVVKKDGSTVVHKTTETLSSKKSWGRVATVSYRRGLFTLMLVDNEKVSNFFEFTDVHPFDAPLVTEENKWDFTYEDCPIGGSTDALACPLIWKAKFSPHLNYQSLLSYIYKGDLMGDEEKLIFTSNDQALRDISARYNSQLEWYGAELGEDMTEYKNKFRRHIEGLLNDIQLVSCKGSYWAPSVNSTVCYFINLRSKEVTRIEHGDTDG